MKELSIKEKAEAYDEALEKIKKLVSCGLIYEDAAIQVFPILLKEPEDEKIRKFLIKWVQDNYYHGTTEIPTKTLIAWLEKQGGQNPTLPKWKYKKDHTPLLRDSLILNKYGCVAKSPSGAIVSDVWVLDYDELAKLPKEGLEKQGEMDKTSYEVAEKEKREFVGDGFVECHADFLDFKEGNTYWLEYIGDDKYNVRSDNLLGKTYHITPCQLYTIFKKLTWLEKQNSNVDNANKEYWRGYREGKQEVLDKYAEKQDKEDSSIQQAYEQGYTEGKRIERKHWLEKGTKEPKKTSIWKHWKDGICGNGEGKLIYLIKNDDDYILSSCLGHECDYIELSDLDKLISVKDTE